MELLLDPNVWIAFAMLTALEIVLGIDNIVFIAILTDRLPREQQPLARRLGLGIAMVSRILLLLTLNWLKDMTTPLWDWTSLGVPRHLFPEEEHPFAEINGVSVRDIILLIGGLFLIFKSVHEIHAKMEGRDQGFDEFHGSAFQRSGERVARVVGVVR